MKGIVSADNSKKFNPTFMTLLKGKSVGVTLQDFKSNPGKYINSGISYLYENEEELKEYFSNVSTTSKPEKLDMNRATRGKTFTENKEVSSRAAKMLEDSVRRRKRITEKFNRNKAKIQRIQEEKLREVEEAKNSAPVVVDEVVIEEVKEAPKTAPKTTAKTSTKTTAKTKK